MIVDAIASVVLNNLLLVVIPLGLYWLYHRLRWKRRFTEVAHRAGLRRPTSRSLAFAGAMALATVAALLVWPPGLDTASRPGSAFAQFVGLGLDGTSVGLALLYGVLKTGFPEELLFRGLVAGSLFRRLPLVWANGIQATIFLLPHLLLLKIMPESWPLMPVIFVGALCLGWLRATSGSIVGPWIVHATANVVTCLSVAIRSSG